MLKKKLEPKIDRLLGEKLREPSFLSSVLDSYNETQARVSTTAGIERPALVARLEALRDRKQRVLDTFFDGGIDKGERDARLAEIDRETDAFHHILTDTVNPSVPLTVQDLRACLEPLAEWEYLDRDDKRALLALICPQISVSRCTVKSVGLNLGWRSPSGDEDSHFEDGVVTISRAAVSVTFPSRFMLAAR